MEFDDHSIVAPELTKIFFFHLPKAGGTAITAALAARFEEAVIAPNIESNLQDHELNRGLYEKYRGYDFYAGHYGMDIFNAVCDGHVLVGNFRHPVARIYSLYRFFREISVPPSELSKKHYNAVRLAKTSPFCDFVATKDEAVAIYTSNQHARQLTGSPWALQSSIEESRATEVVHKMKCLYICEDAEKSSAWFSSTLKIGEIPTCNVTTTPAEENAAAVDAAVERILDRNLIDLKLYECALSLLRHATFHCPGSNLV